MGSGQTAGSLAELGPLEIRQVRRTAQEASLAELMQAHHYLRYTQPVGEHLKYLVFAGDRPIACLAWSCAPRHLNLRDRFIGWPAAVRRANLHLIAYNTRFLVLPWAKSPHLASHLLGQIAQRISDDWQKVYAHPIHLLETFIDPARFQGACYRAANWIYLGLTSGRGHNDRTNTARSTAQRAVGLSAGRGFSPSAQSRSMKATARFGWLVLPKRNERRFWKRCVPESRLSTLSASAR